MNSEVLDRAEASFILAVLDLSVIVVAFNLVVPRSTLQQILFKLSLRREEGAVFGHIVSFFNYKVICL